MFESQVFVQLLILLGSVTAVATLCYYLKLPTIVGFIFAGMAVGPAGLGLVSSLPNADSVAEVAVVFLMFTIGLEFSFKRLLALRREFLLFGFTQVVLTIMVTAIIARRALGVSLGEGLFLGILVSLSSTALVMKLLTDARDLESPYGRSSLSILLFQDIATIPMMLVLPLLAGHGQVLANLAPLPIARTLWEVCAFLVGLWVATRYLIPFLMERIVATRSREVFFFTVLFVCLGTAYLFELSGLSLSLGAFAAGLMISESPYGRQVTADITPLRDSFLGFFFASVGMLLDLRFVWAHIGVIIIVALTIFLVKAFVLALVSLFNRQPVTIAVIVALILNQIGEFSFILASRGLDLGIIDQSIYQYFLCISVLSMMATPFLFRLAPRFALARPLSLWKLASAGRAALPVKAKVKAAAKQSLTAKRGDLRSGHAIIIGFGITGQNVAAAMSSLGIPYQAIELNYEVVKKLKRKGVAIHYGDATRADVLEHAGIDTAGLVIVAVFGAKLLGSILGLVRQLRPDVQIIVRAQYVRDVEAIRHEPRTDIVVAEIETTVELLARSLRVYGVAAEDIRRYMEQARLQLNTHSQTGSSLASPNLSLPSWEALSSIRPLRIGTQFYAHGKPLVDLGLPRRTGAAVVTVFREGLGTTVPTGTFVLKANDVVHVVGSPEALQAAEDLLKTGKITDEV